MTNALDFKAWIQEQTSEDYSISVENDDEIKLTSDYGEATIRFTQIDEFTIVEFSIISNKDNSSKFYLHFELKDEDYAKQLFNEMVETLVNLKNEKTLQVLLSCTAGLTTGMFAENLNSVTEMLGLDYHFNAVSYVNIYEEVENYDVVLIAPQIGYMLNRLKETLPNKLVLQIPTAVFASYNTMEAIKYIQEELEKFNEAKNKTQEHICTCCNKYKKYILSIALLSINHQIRISYNFYHKGEIIDSNLIIKNRLCIHDIYDIIDTLLLKHSHIDIIGIATPGIIKDNGDFINPSNEKIIAMKSNIEDRYENIKVVVYNNANAAAVGFQLEHPEYQNIVYHSQQFGNSMGGQGIILNGNIITGKNGIAGELKYFIKRMQLSDDIDKLVRNQSGALEIVTKSLLPSIILMGPEAVAVCAQMTPDMDELKRSLNSFIDEEFMPEFYYIKDPSSYMLSGITELCANSLRG